MTADNHAMHRSGGGRPIFELARRSPPPGDRNRYPIEHEVVIHVDTENSNVTIDCISLITIAAFASGSYAVLGIPIVTTGLGDSASPLLRPHGNYGQFGMLGLVTGPCLFVVAMSYGIIPLLNFRHWLVASLPFLLLGVLIGYLLLSSNGFDLRDAVVVALILGCTAIHVLGVVFATLFAGLRRWGIG